MPAACLTILHRREGHIIACQIPGACQQSAVHRATLRALLPDGRAANISTSRQALMKPRKTTIYKGMCGAPVVPPGCKCTPCARQTPTTKHQAPPMHTCVKPAHGIRIIQLSTKMPSAVVHDL
ncbi:hypothetical protein HPP92_006888 [Vanilla planifolia]|uniref:Uncharacterized protein n=1 Tax=Vanilla planifolia TaxID=51239 RepID=A0A835RD24_VANPL|nr:hypothetical protein HPP92_007122 [Vanilla planifolia]KAG0490025.1 hypothetical protein HPP92_006888 [Vanilla planifolia]